MIEVFKYIIRRLLTLVPTFLGITIISFSVMHIAPGEPMVLQANFNPKMTPEMRQRLRAQFGLDKPLYVFTRMLYGARNAISIAFIMVVSIPLGVASAVRHNSPLDHVTTVLVYIGYAAPSFWIALLLMILFGVKLGWLPISGLHSLMGKVLGLDAAPHPPCLCLQCWGACRAFTVYEGFYA